ncbi:MAG: TetR/AcrR family transcriptional regulator [Deferrisomatales bacterium]
MSERKPRGGRDERALETRRKVVEAATRLFARRGYHRTTVADLAAAIGMTQGAIFHHFASKEALLDAVIEGLARGLDKYRGCLTGTPSSENVRCLVHLMVSHFRRQPDATICLAALSTEFAGTGDPVLERIRAAYAGFVEAFEVALSHHPRVKNPRAAAIAFVGAMQGGAIQGLLREGEVEIEDLAEGFLGLLEEW